MGGLAPLLGTPANPVPDGACAEWFEGPAGVRLRAALFLAPGAARGSVIVSPGRTEAIEKYFETIEDLRGRGFSVLVHDWRGQGLSARPLADRLIGHARGWRPFLGDFAALLAAFEARLPRPWIALGHSMGGCLTLLAMAEGESRFAGVALSAPMMGLQTGTIPPRAARFLAAALVRAGAAGRPAGARETAPTPFADNIVTHDPERYARNEAIVAAWPELALGQPSWGWIDFALSATARLQARTGLDGVSVPAVLVAAGDERLVDNAAIRKVAALLPRGRALEIAGAFHELLQETDPVRAQFWRAFDELAEVAAPLAG